MAVININLNTLDKVKMIRTMEKLAIDYPQITSKICLSRKRLDGSDGIEKITTRDYFTYLEAIEFIKQIG